MISRLPPPYRFCRIATVSACLLVAGTVIAQSFSFFREQETGRSQRGDTPTVITSDTLDIDIANDLATFSGNVIVEDEAMHISCNRMIIILATDETTPDPEPKPAPDAAKPATTTATEDNQPPPTKSNRKDQSGPDEDDHRAAAANKRVSRIICVGDVVIIRKQESEGDEPRAEQKAIAGKAEYDIASGQIILTEDPVLMRGTDSLRGERITIWRDSDKMKVEGSSRLEMRPDTLRDDKRPGDPQ